MRRVGLLLLGVLLVAALGTVGVASAETMKIGVIDLSIVMAESSAGKAANAQLNQFVAQRRSDLAEREGVIVSLESELTSDASEWSDQERQEKEEELNGLIGQYLQLVDQYEMEIQQVASELRSHLLSEIGAVLQWYGDNRDYSLIIDASSALYYRRVVDLTYDIIREYDALRAAAQTGPAEEGQSESSNP